jgi:hypothetical protein
MICNLLTMNTLKKKILTQSKRRATLKAMASPPASIRAKRSNPKSSHPQETTIEDQYVEFFVPRVSPLWAKDADDYSLEQPSPLKPVPTETSYMDGGIVYPPTFA